MLKKDKEKERFLIEFGQHLRKIRKQKGISLRELELRGDFDRQLISKIELGQKNVGIFTLKKLCTYLEIEFKDLFENFE